MALIVTLALSMLVVIQAPALAPWRSMADATLQVKKACIDGVRLDIGAKSPRPLDEDPPSSPLSPTEDVLVRARIDDPISGQLILDKQVTLPLDPRVIKLIDGEAARIDYFKRSTLRWNQQLEVGQTVSLKAVFADLFADAGEEASPLRSRSPRRSRTAACSSNRPSPGFGLPETTASGDRRCVRQGWLRPSVLPGHGTGVAG